MAAVRLPSSAYKIVAYEQPAKAPENVLFAKQRCSGRIAARATKTEKYFEKSSK
jgi:hypothetical protein